MQKKEENKIFKYNAHRFLFVYLLYFLNTFQLHVLALYNDIELTGDVNGVDYLSHYCGISQEVGYHRRQVNCPFS